MELSAFLPYSKTVPIKEPTVLCIRADQVGWGFLEHFLWMPSAPNDFAMCYFKTCYNYNPNHWTWSSLPTLILQSACSTDLLVFHSSLQGSSLLPQLRKHRCVLMSLLAVMSMAKVFTCLYISSVEYQAIIESCLVLFISTL